MQVELDDLVCTRDIAAMAGVSSSCVSGWFRKFDFPRPLKRFANQWSVWDRNEIVEWLNNTGRGDASVNPEGDNGTT